MNKRITLFIYSFLIATSALVVTAGVPQKVLAANYTADKNVIYKDSTTDRF